MRPAALLAALALALSLSGCGGSGDSSGVLLYFCADPARGTPHGPAIRSQPYQGRGELGWRSWWTPCSPGQPRAA